MFVFIPQIKKKRVKPYTTNNHAKTFSDEHTENNELDHGLCLREFKLFIYLSVCKSSVLAHSQSLIVLIY